MLGEEMATVTQSDWGVGDVCVCVCLGVFWMCAQEITGQLQLSPVCKEGTNTNIDLTDLLLLHMSAENMQILFKENPSVHYFRALLSLRDTHTHSHRACYCWGLRWCWPAAGD